MRRREEETANIFEILKKKSQSRGSIYKTIFFSENGRLISLTFIDVYKAAEYWMVGTSEILESELMIE